MPKASAISAADICLYSRCPRSYWLGRVEEVPPTVTGPRAQEVALATTIFKVLKGEIAELDEALGRFEMELAERCLAVDWSIGSKQESLLADGQRWLNHFWVLERPQIKIRHAGVVATETFRFKLSKKVTITANCHIVEGSCLGWIRCCDYRWPKSKLYSNLYYQLAAAVANSMNTYVLVCSRGGGEIIRRRWCFSSGTRATMLATVDHAIKGMKRKFFKPCDPAAEWCTKWGCQWFKECRERMSEEQS